MDRTKWIFWGAILSALALICVPSTLLLDALLRYHRLVEGLGETPLRPLRAHFVPHGTHPSIEKPRLEFVVFGLKAPRAKTVELIGDFNGWRPGTLKLSRQAGGRWGISMPLPKGHYRYVFMVDGRREQNPESAPSEYFKGFPVSIKEVKGTK